MKNLTDTSQKMDWFIENKDGSLILCKQTNYNGYYRISVVKPKHKLLRVHRLVWETFNGEIPERV